MKKLQRSLSLPLKTTGFLLAFLFYIGIQAGYAQYTPLYSFGGGTAGNAPYGSLILSGKVLYGMTSAGGANSDGMIFSIDTTGAGFTDLYDFNSGSGGSTPYGSLAISGNVLYGETYDGGAGTYGTIFSIHTDGSAYTDLFDFNNTTGANPVGALTLSGSTLYGATELGGVNNDGVIFSISTTGTGYTDLHDFNSTDGLQPNGLLTLSGSVLYGSTSLGNTLNYGVIFSINTNGSGFTDLYNFDGTHGSDPLGGLTLSGSVLYGTTESGGANSDGTIFSINTNGTGYSDLYDFNGTTGSNPSHAVLNLLGNLLYGLTENGGANGDGVLFSINTNGSGFSDLIDFSGFNGSFPGAYPLSSLTPSGSNLYGMTNGGGANLCGVVFKYSSIPSGINNIIATNGDVTLYPNPSNGKFTIAFRAQQSEKATIEVYNVLGEELLSHSLENTQAENIVDLVSQSNGIYIYKVITETGNLIGQGKLVVQ